MQVTVFYVQESWKKVILNSLFKNLLTSDVFPPGKNEGIHWNKLLSMKDIASKYIDLEVELILYIYRI